MALDVLKWMWHDLAHQPIMLPCIRCSHIRWKQSHPLNILASPLQSVPSLRQAP